MGNAGFISSAVVPALRTLLQPFVPKPSKHKRVFIPASVLDVVYLRASSADRYSTLHAGVPEKSSRGRPWLQEWVLARRSNLSCQYKETISFAFDRKTPEKGSVYPASGFRVAYSAGMALRSYTRTRSHYTIAMV